MLSPHTKMCIYLYIHMYIGRSFPGGSGVKNPPAKAGVMDSIPGLGRSLQKERATDLSILTWKIAWTEELGRLQSMGLPKSWAQLND